MKILVVQGHPDEQSFTYANAFHYYLNAKQNGHSVDFIDLSKIDFDPVLRFGYRKHMDDESFTKHFQELLMSADHIAYFFPIWWGSEPSVLTGLIDRTFTPGFAYKYKNDTLFPQKLLLGKTADLFVTCRAPGVFYRLPGKVLSKWKSDILGFCGIKTKNVYIMGRMNTSKDTNKRRKKYIQQCSKTLDKF